MNPTLSNICIALDELHLVVLTSWTDDRTVNEAYGWHHPCLTRQDLARLPLALADRLREANIETIEKELEVRLNDVPRRLGLLHSETVPHMFNGNGYQAIPAFIATLDALAIELRPVLGWQLLSDNKAMPAKLATRLRSIQAEIDAILLDKEGLQSKIRQIEEANEAAESLPQDLQSLRNARNELAELRQSAQSDAIEIGLQKGVAAISIEEIKQNQEDADYLVEQCGEAYRVTTSKGLASAFDQRASSLATSMWVWVVGLMLALVIGAFIGADRIQLLSGSLNAAEPQWGVIWMQAFLSLLTIGGPLWFSWLATKQIGQRFRLAEDYAFKASVAKAYEGYRREAARIDEVFEARLFSAALSRLEEAPLRLVEGATHGSPWHELISSPAFLSALDTAPALREKFVEIAKAGMDTFKTLPVFPSKNKPTQGESSAEETPK
jgi:hypothetical protein